MRKHLLAKHHSAEPALDRLRHEVLAAEFSTGAAASFWATLWQELFVQPRRIWAGMGAVWLVALLLNVTSGSDSPTQMAKQPLETAPEVRQAVLEQKRLRDELLGIGVATIQISPADKPRDGLKPRSERQETYAVA
jgi:hypothetical protein